MQYEVIDVNEFLRSPATYINNNTVNVVWFAKKGKHKKSYLELYCGFDIETYTTLSHRAYMYIWQFSLYDGLHNYIIIGRVWSDFVLFIKALKNQLGLNNERRLIIGVANLGFEHQYIKKYFSWSKVFARERRQPILAICDDCFEFRDVLAITGGSLKTLAKEYTTTQKLDGDAFDYTEKRTYKTKLTKEQLQYCYNDVAIISEYMAYLFKTYIKPDKYIPLTKTGLLRREVKQAMGKGTQKRLIMSEIYRCYPSDFDLYSILMSYCFRGGYTHSNLRYTGYKIDGIHSRDITSSYPYTMLAYDGFPVSPLKREGPEDFEKLFNAGDHCLMFSVTFTGLKAKTDHAIESKSKAVTISKNAIIDNGRIRSAAQFEVWLTELDFIIYMLYYEWLSYKINVLYSSVKGRLPNYLLMPLAKAYEKKAKMKHEGMSNTTEYALYKSLVNSAYGMTVTKLNTSEVKMSELSYMWYLDPSDFDYEKERKKAFLLPQWGIYICAYSRYRIQMAIYNMIGSDGLAGKDSIYTDTDSIKYIGDHEDYFDTVNKQTAKTMKDVCDLYGLDYQYFYDLGSFEPEYNGRTVSGKFLGAKRYIITDQGETSVTIAGLPKKSLTSYINKLKLQHDIFEYGAYPDIYDIFSDGMLLDSEVSLKNAHTYNDEQHQDIIDGVLCMELASVGIYPIDFTMKLSDFYLTLIRLEEERRQGYETRIY